MKTKYDVSCKISQCLCIIMFLTCSELSIVKIHAKTVVFSFTANSPIIHVMPSSGNSTTVLFTDVLCTHRIMHVIIINN